MKNEFIEQQRAEIEALVPDAILAIARCLKNPERNSQTQLAAAKTILDRAGLPAVAATEVTGRDGGGIEMRLVVMPAGAPQGESQPALPPAPLAIEE